MADVARAAGVSVMTVSNVLNDRLPVGEPTRARVMAAVDELGYQVNLTARHLRAGRTDTIAFIAPSFHDYFGEVADRLALPIEAEGRHLVLARTAASPEEEMEALSAARLHLYDGVLLSVAGLDSDRLERVRTAKPLVLLGERDAPERFDHVRLANEEGARLATAHMIDGGSRRIVALGGTIDPGHTMSSDRRLGWERAMTDAGLGVDPRYVVPFPVYSSAAARDALLAVIDSGLPFDGVFSTTDVVALGAISALSERGLRIPEDVQVTGFDNLEMAQFVPPGLTSVDANHEELAEKAVGILHRRIAGWDGPAEHVVIPVRLVVRGSTRGQA
ncbi:LacI family DNA-binding transcriptional regulator [Microbacterium sp. NEAU-LLC]|uniref:LacI family DNA-binding transcriptional regulator n=1 Tax=Microbacterium helvum TaxID=2773713 RepID=A0ABR8NS88_9MICO|nr:LacI family DNA-binding transcriptional regulator [Microbacterium helvum]MBD3943505.1 LacI family DNA-binding transcriptional regulator [Microbacterium helvum]